MKGRRVSTSRKDWDKMDWDKAEKQLEEGDDEELLERDDAKYQAELERRRGQGMTPPPPEVGLKDPAEWVKHTQAMSGPAMLFCTLTDVDPRDGKPWTNETTNRAAYEWRELLKTGGLEAQVYDISDDKAKRMLVTMNQGWNAYELRDFLLRQPELKEMEWDQVKYSPSDLEKLERSKGKKRADPLKNLRREMAQPPGAPEGAENAVPAPQPPKKKKAKAPKKAAAAKEEEL